MSWLFRFILILGTFCQALTGWHRGLRVGVWTQSWWEEDEEEKQCGDHQRRQGLNSNTQPKLLVWSSQKRGSSSPQRLEFIPLCIISSGWWATCWIKLSTHIGEKILSFDRFSRFCVIIEPPSLKFLQMWLRVEIMWLRCCYRDDLTGTGCREACNSWAMMWSLRQGSWVIRPCLCAWLQSCSYTDHISQRRFHLHTGVTQVLVPQMCSPAFHSHMKLKTLSAHKW